MKARIVDLRYNMKKVLKALDAQEPVTIYCHGKIRGVIQPVPKKKRMRVEDHPFCGMAKGDRESVSALMDRLRGGRYRDL